MSPDHLSRSSIKTHQDGRSYVAVRPWRVLHTIPVVAAPSLSPVIHAQQHAGMRPYLLCEEGILPEAESNSEEEPAGRSSLLRSWRQVRDWKRQLDSYSFGGLEIIHAHCFSAGMAAVRRPGAVVYDLKVCIEELVREEARRSGSSGERTWLARSLRAAEQFVLSRAGAVIVHSRETLECCRTRGVEEDSLFLIFDLLCETPAGKRSTRSAQAVARAYDHAYRHAFANQRTPGGQNLGGGLVLQTSS